MKKIGLVVPGWKLSKSGKSLVRDEKAIEAKLDVSKRITRRKSKRVRVVKPDAFRV